jgi:hypothetical protein
MNVAGTEATSDYLQFDLLDPHLGRRSCQLLTAAGAKLDAFDRAEIRGLLSGSEVAERKVAELTPAVADEVERVVRGALVYAFDGAMLLCMAMSVASVLAALLVVGKRTQPQRTAGPTPGTGQSRRLGNR